MKERRKGKESKSKAKLRKGYVKGGRKEGRKEGRIDYIKEEGGRRKEEL